MDNVLDGMKNKTGSYTGIFENNVINVLKTDKEIIFRGITEKDIEETVVKYFDLEFSYEKAKEKLSKIDEHLEKSIKYGEGIRILRQNLWETIISFIISANNNIPRIKGIIERISKKYGKKIVFDNKEYYTFPTPEELMVASIPDLRGLGLGFRDVRVYETTKLIASQKFSLKELQESDNVGAHNCAQKREKLLTLSGVGPKVADCIMLFGLNKKEVFPIDVWIERVMNELYGEKNKLNKKQIESLAEEKYGDLAGLAQQYLFYYIRNKK